MSKEKIVPVTLLVTSSEIEVISKYIKTNCQSREKSETFCKGVSCYSTKIDCKRNRCSHNCMKLEEAKESIEEEEEILSE